jgi:methylase of polypeptide subunit release factors
MLKKDWLPSRVYDRRGVAFYDSILIQGDSLYNPRPDRVLPVAKEEQIFVSRMMRPQLQSGWRVLDVGTGSGVYAIEAARKGCSVVAIDSNPRACRFARSNAYVNAIEVVDDAATVGRGQIAIIEAEFNSSFNMGEFDAIILSPPYTPTPPELDYLVAQHASAGRDGLENFRKQIQNVPRMLKPGAVCFGNQLSVVRRSVPPISLGTKLTELIKDQQSSNYIEVVHLLKEAFAGTCELRCVPILDELIATDHFINEEFKGVREQINNDNEAKNKLDQWQKDLTEEFQFLALVYYEIRKGGDGSVTLGETPWEIIPEEERESFSWSRRVRVHRACVDHRLWLGPDPLPVFLTNGTTDSLLSYESAVAIDETNAWWSIPDLSTGDSVNAQTLEYNKILQKNPLLLIDKEIQSQEFGDLFSAIYLDTTPIHPKEGGHYESFLERRVWVNGIGRYSLADPLSRTIATQILDEWERVTSALQAAKCAIGFHPAFTSFVAETKGWRWPEVVSTDYPLRPIHKSNAVEMAKSIVRRHFAEKLLAHDAESRPRFSRVEEFFYSKSTLNELEAKSYRENYDDFLKRAEELKGRLLSLPSDEYRKLDRDIDKEVGLLDLYACQLVMHEAIHEGLNKTINGSFTTKRNEVWPEESMVFSIPLGMIFYKRDADRREFPPFYKGGLWAWFVPSSRRKLRHEEAANHLLQVMWVLLTASYSAISEQAYERLAKNKVTENFAHEVKKVSNALTSQMIRPAQELFKLQQSHESGAQLGGMLGKVELASEMQGKWRAADLGITFFQQSVASAGSMINLWCQDPNLDDAAGVVGGKHRDIQSLVNACWKVCINTLPVYAFPRRIIIDPRNSTSAAQSIEEIKKDEMAIKRMFLTEVLVEGGDRFPALAWGGRAADKKASEATPWLVRLLLALLNNCAAHGNPAYPVCIRIAADKTQRNKFKFSISNKRRRKTGEDTESIIMKLTERGIDEKQARLGLKFLAAAAPVMDMIKVAKFGTWEVVKSCLERLNDEMPSWSTDAIGGSELGASDFVVELSLVYGEEN